MTRRRAVPAAGEIIVLDRGWYNRGGVEYVMDFATEQRPLQESAAKDGRIAGTLEQA
jgi:polyphosphate kinase 2 (PPK2 family)